MQTVKLILEYDGTDFNGWQIQDKKSRTVQDVLEKALKIIFKKKIRVYGSGRTDSGVHAKGQVAHFHAVTSHKAETIRNALNANLPEDVSVLDASFADSRFHAQYSAKRKSYRYTILNRSARTALERKLCLHYPHKMNLRRLKKESRLLVGRHDFRSFTASGSETGPRRGEKLSTIRTVYRLDITRKKDHLFFDIEADGFLYKMVRNIVGTLLESASGRRPEGEVARILKAKNRTRAGITAPACGLCLMRVDY